MSHPPSPIRLLLVDDHAATRAALKGVLSSESDLAVVGEAGNGAIAIELTVSLRPDVVVMDVMMPEMTGIEATARLSELAPQVRILMLTTFGRPADVSAAVRAGATGYLLKDASRANLVAAVRTAAAADRTLAGNPLSPLATLRRDLP